MDPRRVSRVAHVDRVLTGPSVAEKPPPEVPVGTKGAGCTDKVREDTVEEAIAREIGAGDRAFAETSRLVGGASRRHTVKWVVLHVKWVGGGVAEFWA